MSGIQAHIRVVLAVRSEEQQRELDDLEARKSSIRAANSAMSSTMWAWREELFALAAKPSPPITAARLRHIYGEEEPAPEQQDRKEGTKVQEQTCPDHRRSGTNPQIHQSTRTNVRGAASRDHDDSLKWDSTMTCLAAETSV